MKQQPATLKWLVGGLAAIGVILASLAGAALATNGPDDWTNMAPATAASPRQFTAMAYDAESDRVVMFSGIFMNELVGDTWAYDFNTNMWTNVTPATAPSPRYLHAMAYDAESDRIILFGGLGGNDETWAYDFNTNMWTNVTPATAPSARYGHAMAYDAESDRVILFGGALPVSDETWAYDFNANTWTDMTPATAPSARSQPGMGYDAESDRVVLFGGFVAGQGPNDETWAYDFNTNMWVMSVPATAPSPRHLHSMAYDAGSDRIVLFGGTTAETFSNNETWVYDFNANTWTNVEPVTAPSVDQGSPMAYDAESDRVIMFTFPSETWSYGPRAPTGPSAPQNLQATAGDAQVDLTWSPPSDDGGSVITGYNIHRGTAPGGETFLATVGNVLAYTDTGLTNTKTFYYQVSAVNAVGEGPRSNEVSATPMVPDITNPTVTITSPADDSNLATTSMTVSGTASDDVGVEKVELSTDGMTWVLATGTTSWSGTVTLAEGPNTIFARATDPAGNTATVTIAVTVETEPVNVVTFVVVGAIAAAAAGAALLLWRRRARGKEKA